MSRKDDYIIRELRVGSRREAELLADMWNRSDAGWPGGWTGGVPKTAERVLREDMQHDCYGQWVAEHAGEIVGFASLLADPKQPQRAIIGMLNARPDHHGKGVGKRLLRRAVDRAIEGGFQMVELGTWPGNLKAVPLYKKMGFFWSPETNVNMDNFIPSIIRMPLLGDFFEKHDWYQVQQRELAVAEDVEYWHGVRIYYYRFKADGRDVQVLVDRFARTATAVETDELSVAAWVGAEDLCALQEHTLHYEFRNKTDRRVRVSVLAQGEQGVPVTVGETFELRGRHRLTVPFRLPADLERTRPGEPHHRVLSTVTVDGVPIKLGTAVQMRDPVAIECSGWGLPATKWSDVRIKLRNRLPFPVSGMLWLGSPARVERSEEKLSFRIGRGSWTSVSLRLRPGECGAYPVEARVNFSRETARKLAEGETPALAARGRVRMLWVRAFAPGTYAVSEHAEDRQITVESDQMSLRFWRVGGRMQLSDKALGRSLLTLNMPDLGPPFHRYGALPKIYDAEVQNLDGRVHLVTRQCEDRWPALTLERTVVISPGMLTLKYCLLNAADRSAQIRVRTSAYGHIGPGKITIPDGDGLLQHERVGWGDWPGWREAPKRTEDFPETWLAAEEKGAVAGIVWEGDAEVTPQSGGTARITQGPVSVPGGGAVELPTIRFVGGRGDHKTVRSVWATYVHPRPLLTPQERDPRTRQILRGGLSRIPALLTRPAHRLTVELVSEQQRKLNGEACLTLPEAAVLGRGSRELRFPVRGLAKGTPKRRAVTLRSAARKATAGLGELRLASQRQDHVFPVPVVIVRAGRSRLKARQEGNEISLDTGRVRFKVSADHGGSIVSLRLGRRELLRSSYPKPGAYQWMNPWYGGIRAQAGNEWDRRLLAVQRRMEKVSIVGAQGIRWEGARITTVPTHRDWRWLRYEVQYLSTAGSNLLAVLVTARNRTAAPMGTNLTVTLWPHRDTAEAYVGLEGEKTRICRRDQYDYSVQGKGWAAFQCFPKHVLAVAGKELPGWHLHVENMGDRRFNGTVSRWADLNPKAKKFTSLVWVAACESLEEARAYRFLNRLDELP